MSFIQDHDQVGNRPLGDRLGSLTSPQALRALAAIYLLAPEIPLVFMGEEWDSRRPFLYFTDMSPELGETIRKGRLDEFKQSPDGIDHSDELLNPNSEESFLASKLDWTERKAKHNADHLGLYRKLLAIRREEVVPRIAELANNTGRYEIIAGRALKVRWTLTDGSVLHLLANLHTDPLIDIQLQLGRRLWPEGQAGGQTLDGWGVVWSLEEEATSGNAGGYRRC